MHLRVWALVPAPGQRTRGKGKVQVSLLIPVTASSVVMCHHYRLGRNYYFPSTAQLVFGYSSENLSLGCLVLGPEQSIFTFQYLSVCLLWYCLRPKPHAARYSYVAVLKMILCRGNSVFREDHHCDQTCPKATANSTGISTQASPWRGNMCKHKAVSPSEQVGHRKAFILNNKVHRPLKGHPFMPFLLRIHQ